MSTRRASPAAPTSSAAIMNSPGAASGSTAGSSASAAKARPIRCSTSAPRRRSRASTRRCTVRGTGLKPEITFASVPQLPQDELLSRILFGTSITNLSAPEAVQLASAVAALQSGCGQPRPDQRGAPRGRARPAADRPGRRRDRAEDRDLGGQIYRPQIVRRSDHRRAGLFGDARRISGDALALVPVVDLDHRPDQRQRRGSARIIEAVAPLDCRATLATTDGGHA